MYSLGSSSAGSALRAAGVPLLSCMSHLRMSCKVDYTERRKRAQRIPQECPSAEESVDGAAVLSQKTTNHVAVDIR